MDAYVRIRGEWSLPKFELKSLQTFLQEQNGIESAEFREENILGVGAHVSWLLLVKTASETYLGKKILDVIADLVKEWLKRSPVCLKHTITLYGGDNKVISVVECEERTKGGKLCRHARWRMHWHRVLRAFSRAK